MNNLKLSQVKQQDSIIFAVVVAYACAWAFDYFIKNRDKLLKKGSKKC